MELESALNPPPLKIKAQRRIMNQDAADNFSSLSETHILMGIDHPDVFIQTFDGHCVAILDKVSVLKSGCALVNLPYPWINGFIRSLRWNICGSQHI